MRDVVILDRPRGGQGSKSNVFLDPQHFVLRMTTALLVSFVSIHFAKAEEAAAPPAEAVTAESPESPGNGLPLPRFASLRSNRVYARTGPGKRYPIVWEYHLKAAPVEIVDEFDYWRRIRDWQGDLSWVHKSMLSGRRSVYVLQDAELKRGELPQSGAIAAVKKGAFGQIVRCQPTQCEVDFTIRQGWIPRTVLWGVYEDEVLK